ncbi:3606_t:CDS:2 [Ambispora gerdemannii]|uniref:3606_t:CDS:1 n=1 Tax=Ambispora gerdemannii TaxID=144530 RepID=A0A9N9B2H5_9GLOM|nr:3606_t:CDS:2 [Ambispora gerdemannii]
MDRNSSFVLRRLKNKRPVFDNNEPVWSLSESLNSIFIRGSESIPILNLDLRSGYGAFGITRSVSASTGYDMTKSVDASHPDFVSMG